MDGTLETVILIRTKRTVITANTSANIKPLIQILTYNIEPFHEITAGAMILVEHHTADGIGENVIILRMFSLVIVKMLLSISGTGQISQRKQNVQIVCQLN